MDEDRTAVTRLIVGAFNEWVDEFFGGVHPQDDEALEHGRRLLGIPEERSNVLNIMWTAFYGGVGQGIVFRGELENLTADGWDKIKEEVIT